VVELVEKIEVLLEVTVDDSSELVVDELLVAVAEELKAIDELEVEIEELARVVVPVVVTYVVLVVDVLGISK
jgi:phosphate uptake regulator